MLIGRAPQQVAADLLVAVGKDVGLDDNDIADDRLHRVATAVELRRQPLDDHATGAQVFRLAACKPDARRLGWLEVRGLDIHGPALSLRMPVS